MYLHPHPEIQASVQGDLHWGTDHLPRDTVKAPPDSPKDQLPPPLLSPTNSSTSFCNTSSQRDETLSRLPDYLVPPPQVVQFRTSGHHPHLSLKLGLTDPHALEEDIIYTVMQALCSQIGAMMCAVLVLPHMTPASLIDQY